MANNDMKIFVEFWWKGMEKHRNELYTRYAPPTLVLQKVDIQNIDTIEKIFDRWLADAQRMFCTTDVKDIEKLIDCVLLSIDDTSTVLLQYYRFIKTGKVSSPFAVFEEDNAQVAKKEHDSKACLACGEYDNLTLGRKRAGIPEDSEAKNTLFLICEKYGVKPSEVIKHFECISNEGQ